MKQESSRPIAGRVLIIQGHPDGQESHFCHALAQSYAEGAREAGREVESIEVARLDFPLLRSKRDWDHDAPPRSIAAARHAIEQAQHLVILFPLWLGGMPALLKGFMEQVLRPGLGAAGPAGSLPAKALRGRSARIVVTMGMPSLVYRWYFRAHGVRSLMRSILGLVGVAPVRLTLIGSIESIGDERRAKWLGRLRALGARGL